MIVYEPSPVADVVGILRLALAVPPVVSVTLDGERVGTKPGDETTADSVMVPLRELILASVIVAETEVPRRTGMDCGLAEIENSGAAPVMSVMVVECDSGPTDPVTVTE